MKKLYVIQKYVIAESIEDAIKREKKESPSDVYLDNDWKKAHMPTIKDKDELGFGKK